MGHRTAEHGGDGRQRGGAVTDPGHTAGGRPAVVIDLERAGFSNATEVGRGGFGVVFRCNQEALNRTVAVKLLHTDLDTVSRERFFREGRAMGGLSGHPNVVDVLQVGVTHSGRPYIVMPFQSLDSLAARVRREGPLDWAEATRLGVRLSGALECAHRVGTLHRDVKPANILLSDYGEAQLTDFGIARIEGGFETATGAFTGSLSYTAPEVLNGHPPTPASDIYGLGAALFSIIAGRAAFERREGEEIIAQFLRITGQPIPDLRGHGVPDELCAVLEHAMAKDPAERPASAEALGRELQEVQRAAGQPVAEMALPAVRRPTGNTDLTEAADLPVDDRSPRRVSGPLPLVDRPWDPTATVRPAPSPTPSAAPTAKPSPAPRPAPPDGEGATVVVASRPRPTPPGGGAPPSGPAGPTGPGATPPPRAPRRRLALVAAVVTVVVLLAGLTVAGIFVFRGGGGASTAAAPASESAVTAVVPASAWRTLAPDPVPRQQVATTVQDGVVWVIGGLTDTGATNKVERYDPAINTWTDAIDLPVALHHAMAVSYRGAITVLGGWIPNGSNLSATSSNKVYSQQGGGWVELPPMPSAHVAGGAIVVGDKIVVSGGQADGKLNPATEVFDGTKWTTAPDLPTPREHTAMVTDGTYVYVVGGRALSSDKNSAVLERFDPKTDTWTSLAPMPAPRGGLGATFTDGRIIAVGGEEPTTVDNSVFSYDVKSDSWSTLPPMPTPRHGLSVSVVGRTLFAFDGAAKPSHTDSVGTGEAIDLPPRRLAPAPKWRELKDAPIARQFAGTTVDDGTLWIAGGLTQDAASQEVWGYDAAIDTWKKGPDLPIALHHTDAVTYKGDVVVLGGWTPQNGNLSAVVSDKVFALRNGTWAALPPMPEPRTAAAATVVGDKIIVVGGQNGGKLAPATEVFDGTSWSLAAPIPTPREHLAATTDGTYVYAVGGRDLSSSKNTFAFERFDPAAGTWQTMPTMPTARGGVAAACIDGRIVAAGGEEPTRVLATVEAYDIATGTWSTLAPLGVPRHGMSMAAIGNSVFAVGGAQKPTHADSAATVEALDFS
ncbi:MAG: protein kinase [Pseudonocardia sp.]|jgi:non-specific serine/threonine protein kinase|nr:protein kinase [Pseudonocardia sp.]